MPTYRTRSKSHKTQGSGTAVRSYLNLTFYSGFAPITSDYEYCADHTQPPPFSDDTWWNKYRSTTYGGVTSGTCSYGYAGGGTVTFNDCRQTNRTGYQYVPETTVIDMGYWKTLALANLDPSKPVVDLPLFLFELREFPRMLKDLGRVLNGRVRPSDVPGGHLAYEFGWKPLVSDALSLITLQRQVSNRIAYLRSLEKGTRVRRTLTRNRLIKDTLTTDGLIAWNVGPAGSNPYGVKADLEVREYLTVWFTANAKLIDDLPDDKVLPRDTYRRLLGLSARPSTLWNALPWSWLSDYFVNIGDFIEAKNALTRYQCTRMNVMAHQYITSTTVNVRTKQGLSYTPSVLVKERKRRTFYANPQPSISMEPFLTNRQRGILGSLITASALRASRR